MLTSLQIIFRMNSKIFDIDFEKLGRWLLPVRKRKPAMLAFVLVLAVPFVFIYASFKAYRKQKLYELSLSPQICYVRKLLNDLYDKAARRIYITNAEPRESPFVYRRAENKPLYLATQKYLYGTDETILYDNFTVHVPAVLGLDLVEVAGLLSTVVLPGMKFKIETF